MNTAADSHHDSTSAVATSRPSPAPSTAGSTGTSGITVRTGPNGQMSFRRWVRVLIPVDSGVVVVVVAGRGVEGGSCVKSRWKESWMMDIWGK